MSRRSDLGLVLVTVGAPVAVVGFGMVAASQFSRLSPKPEKPGVRLVDVLVASKPLDPGTRFTRDSLKDQVTRKKYKPDEVPENAVTDEAELIGKTLDRCLRTDGCVRTDDLGSPKPDETTPGKDLISIRMTGGGTTPFLKPGSRIDIFGTGVNRRSQVVGIVILPNMLVMAEGIECPPRNDQSVTVAVTTEEALLLRMCQTAGVRLSYSPSGDGCEEHCPRADRSPAAVRAWLAENFMDPADE